MRVRGKTKNTSKEREGGVDQTKMNKLSSSRGLFSTGPTRKASEATCSEGVRGKAIRPGRAKPRGKGTDGTGSHRKKK